MNDKKPYLFEEFLSSGLEEDISPFLNKTSRKLAHNLLLKNSLLSGFLFICSFVSQFYSIHLSNFFLIFVYFLVGTPAFLNMIENMKNLEININVLMSLSAFLSFLIGNQMEGGMLLVLFSLSSSMENVVTRKAKRSLNNLNNLAPTIALVVDKEGEVFQKSVRDIDVGEKILVKAGEIVPLDGNVVEGRSFVNLSHLTGESVPVSKNVKDDVQAGSLNMDGTLVIQVTKISSETTLSKIIQLINEARDRKPRLQLFLDRFSRMYATIVISLFFIFSISLPFFISIPFLGNEGSIYRALAFLITASPCALIIATPTAYLSAISSCARNGVLLKGGFILDVFASCKAIAFDKTGTLTTGKLVCVGVECLSNSNDVEELTLEEAIGIAAGLEKGVKHPIADAISRFAVERKIKQKIISDFKLVSGFGACGKYLGLDVKIGNREFVYVDIDFDASDYLITFLLVGKSLFVFKFRDKIRFDMSSILQNLRNKNLELIMLTGDRKESALHVANSVNIKKVYYDLRPDNKLKIVSNLSDKYPLAMVGDGINDAPALTRANVGISMGKIGSSTAINASDIVLLQDDMSLIYWIFNKSKKTIRIVRENILLALGIIILTTTPSLLGIIPLWLAVILHEGGTIIVGINSLRLLKK